MRQLETELIPFDILETGTCGMKNARTSLEDFSDIVESLRSTGILRENPIAWKTTDSEEGVHYVLLAGHRRCAAIAELRKAEDTPDGFFDEINVQVFEGSLSEALALNLTDNDKPEQREVNPMDQCAQVALLYKTLKQEKVKSPQTTAGRLLGNQYSQSWVSNRLSIAGNGCRAVKNALRDGGITVSQAIELSKFAKKDEQVEELEKLVGSADGKVTKRKRRKTFRSKSECEELLVILRDNEGLDIDDDHRSSVIQCLLWTLNQIETEQMLFRVQETESVEIVEEEPAAPVRKKRRIRVGQ